MNVNKIESVTNCVTLLKGLVVLVLLFNSMGLNFNVGKCQSTYFTKIRNTINYTYLINDSNIGVVTSKNDLGIIFKFNSHIKSDFCRLFKMLCYEYDKII